MELLLSKISLNGANFHWQVALALVIIWMIVLGCSWHSIIWGRITLNKKIFWLFFVTVVPIFGVLVYLPFSIDMDRLSNLPIWRSLKSRISTSAS